MIYSAFNFKTKYMQDIWEKHRRGCNENPMILMDMIAESFESELAAIKEREEKLSRKEADFEERKKTAFFEMLKEMKITVIEGDKNESV